MWARLFLNKSTNVYKCQHQYFLMFVFYVLYEHLKIGLAALSYTHICKSPVCICVWLTFFVCQDFSSDLIFCKPMRQQRGCPSLPITIKPCLDLGWLYIQYLSARACVLVVEWILVLLAVCLLLLSTHFSGQQHKALITGRWRTGRVKERRKTSHTSGCTQKMGDDARAVRPVIWFSSVSLFPCTSWHSKWEMNGK